MQLSITNFANVTCGLLIMMYAWDRFNTPVSNRQSTSRALYRWSCIGYMISALALFAAVTILLHLPGGRDFLGLPQKQTLSEPLLATLALTTLLPTLPILKQADAWLLARFREWGAIPGEAKRRASAMTPHSFAVTPEEVTSLREAYDGAYGETLTTHLRHEGAAGIERAELRFTRVVKLYDRIQQLAAVPNYERFFAEAAEEWDGLEHQVDGFMQRAVAWLDRAARLQKVEAQAYLDLMDDRNEVFARECREVFISLVRFLARAVLRSERSERDIVSRLRSIGFETTAPMNLPQFPISSLTLLGVGIFLYLLSVTIVYSLATGAPEHGAIDLAVPLKIATARIAAVGLTIWLVQQFAFFRRAPGEPMRYHAYLVSGAIAAAFSALVCAGFHLGLPRQDDVPVIVLSALLCTAVALCCDDWPDDVPAPFRLRLLEALGCGAVTAATTFLLFFLRLLPVANSITDWGAVAAWITLPSIMAMMIGGFVPHIYRGARMAAAARRDEAAMQPVSRISRDTAARASDAAPERHRWTRPVRSRRLAAAKPPAKAA